MSRALLLAAALAALPAPCAPPADLERGRAVWNFRCYFCHGYSGDAKTLTTTFVDPKPRDFQAADPREFPIERIERAVRDGMPNGTMKGFKGILTDAQIRDVSAFLREEFLVRRARNTSYHTAENGWANHERYAIAFPFARGEIPIDRDAARLTAEQRRGRTLFMGACITCHDHARVEEPGLAWERAGPR